MEDFLSILSPKSFESFAIYADKIIIDSSEFVWIMC